MGDIAANAKNSGSIKREERKRESNGKLLSLSGIAMNTNTQTCTHMYLGLNWRYCTLKHYIKKYCCFIIVLMDCYVSVYF